MESSLLGRHRLVHGAEPLHMVVCEDGLEVREGPTEGVKIAEGDLGNSLMFQGGTFLR